jgi:hypothetical protein
MAAFQMEARKMEFDIHQQLFDKESGEYLEEAAFQYREELGALFASSVEGKMLEDEGIELGWANLVMDLGMGYLEVTPAQMSATDLRTILFQLIPRKISAPADDVPHAIRELQLFWTFLQREFQLENAAACLKVLNEKGTVRRMQEELNNPANFGMAKSLVMAGTERGFDMSTQEGINEWIATYNAEIKAGMGTPLPLPGMPGLSGMSEQRNTGSQKAQASKTKRKVAKSSRKQNQTKK